jgi:RNA recognition motif-containing protein
MHWVLHTLTLRGLLLLHLNMCDVSVCQITFACALSQHEAVLMPSLTMLLLLLLLLPLRLQIIRDRETRVHRGYGFVTFTSAASAQAAITHLNGMAVAGPFQGRQLRVSPSTKAR